MFKKPAFYGVANVGIKIYKTNLKTLIFKPIVHIFRQHIFFFHFLRYLYSI